MSSKASKLLKSLEEVSVDHIEHPIEKEWFHSILTAHGFSSEDKSKKGMVRAYKYTSKDYPDHVITMTNGAQSDHWEDTGGGHGIGSSIKQHLFKLTGKKI